MINTECFEGQNDNLYIKTSIVNNSFIDGSIKAEYNDERKENVVDDACKYELCVYRLRAPRGNTPIKIIDPLLTPPIPNSPVPIYSKIWNIMPEAVRITVDGDTEEENLVWTSELIESYFPQSSIPHNNIDITQSVYDNKSSFIQYYDYFSLYTLTHFCKILNNTFAILHNLIKSKLDPLTADVSLINIPPMVSCDNNKFIIRLHLPRTYLFGNTESKIPIIDFNNRLQLLFGTSLPFKYGRLTGNDENKKWNEIDTSITNNEWITNYDVSDFYAPFDENIFTYNIGGISVRPQFQTFGGFNRMEVYSNIPLVKKEYTQTQNPSSGNIDNDYSNRENLLFVVYLNYNNPIYEDLRYQSPYPYWKSVSNSGALNRISYSVFLVDNLGNRTPYYLQFGNQFNLDIQLRKVF